MVRLPYLSLFEGLRRLTPHSRPPARVGWLNPAEVTIVTIPHFAATLLLGNTASTVPEARNPELQSGVFYRKWMEMGDNNHPKFEV